MTQAPAPRVCLTSHWFIKSGREDRVLKAVRSDLVPAIEAGEEGTLTYFVHRPYTADASLQPLPPTDAQLLLFYEEYASPDAFHAHVNGDIFTGFVAEHADSFVQANGHPYVTVTFLSREAGFARADATSCSTETATGNQHPAVMFEILTPDQERSQSFYSEVFGWDYEVGSKGFAYIHFPNASLPLLGGIGAAHNSVRGMTSGTNFYLLVDDLQSMIQRAEAAGGTALVPPTPIDGYHFAMIKDLDGFEVGLVEPFKT